MKSALTEEQKKLEKETGLEDFSVHEETSEDDFSAILSEVVIDQISSLLTANQRKWILGYCLYGKTPSEVAKEQGLSILQIKHGVGIQLLNLRSIL